MAQLLVRNLDADLVRRLKARAAGEGHSAEEEHRRILRDALKAKAPVPFKELLGGMPGVGEDDDFKRPRERPRAVEL